MADQAAPLPQQAPLPPAARGPGVVPSKTFVARLAATVSSHAYAALAAIIVLTILVIGLYVYYHGLLFLGPYAPAKKGSARARRKKGEESGAEEARGDPETESLIDSINRH